MDKNQEPGARDASAQSLLARRKVALAKAERKSIREKERIARYHNKAFDAMRTTTRIRNKRQPFFNEQNDANHRENSTDTRKFSWCTRMLLLDRLVSLSDNRLLAGLSQKRIAFLGLVAYGPLSVICAFGSLAMLLPYGLFYIINRIFESFGLVSVPLWAFLVVGLLTALIMRYTSRLWPSPRWWQAPWTTLLGIGLCTLLVFEAVKPVLSTTSTFWAALKLLCNLGVGGVVGFFFWKSLFTEMILLVAEMRWEESMRGMTILYARLIGVAKERIFAVGADSQRGSLMVQGSLSDEEVARLQNGIVQFTDDLSTLEIFTGRHGSVNTVKQYEQFKQINLANRTLAIARAKRKHLGDVSSDRQIHLSRYERLVQSGHFGTVITVSIALITFIVWITLSVLSQIKPLGSAGMYEYMKSFFEDRNDLPASLVPSK